MGKLEKKIQIIKEYLPRCNSVYTCYTYGHIPRDKFNNACINYAGHVNYENALGMIDETVFGSGRKGMLFTDKGLYCSDMDGILKYEEGRCFNYLPSSYNLTEVNEMLGKLYEIETAPTGWDIAGSIAGGLLNMFLQDVGSALEESDGTSQNVEDDSIVESYAVEEQNLLEDKGEALEKIDDAQSDILELMEQLTDALDLEGGFLEALQGLVEQIGNEEMLDIISLEECSSEETSDFRKKTKKFANKLKYYISVLQDDDASEDAEEEIMNAKRDIRKYIKVLNQVMDNFENDAF